jgi:hypothetical protein
VRPSKPMLVAIVAVASRTALVELCPCVTEEEADVDFWGLLFD